MFATLGASCMFPALGTSYIFPTIDTGYMFPALGTGYMYSRALHLLHVPRAWHRLIVTHWIAQIVFSCY